MEFTIRAQVSGRGGVRLSPILNWLSDFCVVLANAERIQICGAAKSQ